MKKCCCMENSGSKCIMNMKNNCSRDLKDTPQKGEEKNLVMHLNAIPKFNDLYSTTVDNNFNDYFLNLFNKSLFCNSPLNSQRVFITLSNLRI